ESHDAPPCPALPDASEYRDPLYPTHRTGTMSTDCGDEMPKFHLYLAECTQITGYFKMGAPLWHAFIRPRLTGGPEAKRRPVQGRPGQPSAQTLDLAIGVEKYLLGGRLRGQA